MQIFHDEIQPIFQTRSDRIFSPKRENLLAHSPASAAEKQGINGLFPKPKGRPAMKPKYPKMPPPPKTEEERLRYRILELEAENAYLIKLRELNQAKMRKK